MYARVPPPRHKHYFAKRVLRALCKGKSFFPQTQQKAIKKLISKTKRLRTAHNCAQPVYASLPFYFFTFLPPWCCKCHWQ